MRKTLLFTMFLIASSATAQQNYFYPKPAPGSVRVHKDLALRPGLKFDLYRPANDSVVPLVIVANIGSLAYTGWPIYIGWGEAIAEAGMGGVIYQATQPTALEDFETLMTLLRQKASELRIDPSRVVIWSASANVQLGLPLAMDAKRDYIRGGVVYYGDASVENIRTDLPVMIVRAGLDNSPLNERIDKLIARALAANAPWTIENYGGGLHGFESLNDTEITRALIQRTLSFMKSVNQPALATAYAAAADDARIGAAFARGDWPVAVEGYRKRVGARADDAESNLRLGIALLRSRQAGEALQYIEKAWDLGRRGPRDVAFPAAEAAAAAGNVTRAVHWLDILLSSPFGPPLADIRASESFANIRDEAAFQELLASLEEQRKIEAGGDLTALRQAKSGRLTREAVLLAVAYRLLGRNRQADAVEVFRLVTKRYPNSANAWDSLSEALEASGEKREALEASRRALAVLPADSTLSGPMRESVRAASSERVARLAK
jgi:tetratricopeptide (TPR) repeat protein